MCFTYVFMVTFQLQICICTWTLKVKLANIIFEYFESASPEIRYTSLNEKWYSSHGYVLCKETLYDMMGIYFA